MSAFHIELRSLLGRRAHSGVINLRKMLQEDLQNYLSRLMLNHTDHDGCTGSGVVAGGNTVCVSYCSNHSQFETSRDQHSCKSPVEAGFGNDADVVDHLVSKFRFGGGAAAAAGNIVQ